MKVHSMRINFSPFWTLIFLIFILPLRLSAQVIVETKLDTANILIGEQVQLQVRCVVGTKQKVTFPYYQPQEEIAPGVEVVYNGCIDTLRVDNNKRIELTRRYTITAFDSALYALPPIKVSVDGKEYASRNKVGLKVSTIAVDTLHVDQFSGPHGSIEMPFDWKWRITLLAIFAIVMAIISLILSTRLSDPRLITRRVVIHPPVPAHVTALDEIQKIKSKTDDDSKNYYTSLTSTLRTYIERRFGFNAKEMTTSEIIDELCAIDNVDSLSELKEILLKADLVKFAKLATSISEQDKSLVQALDFIQTTKLEPLEHPKPRIEYMTISGKNQRRARLLMIVGLCTALFLTLGLTGFAIYDLYCCFG